MDIKAFIFGQTVVFANVKPSFCENPKRECSIAKK